MTLDDEATDAIRELQSHPFRINGQVVGDKSLSELSHTDVLDYVDWLDGRVDEEDIVAKTANKYIGHNSKMIKEINRKLRLGLPDFFAGMRLQGVTHVSRPPFPIEFVRDKILAEGALMGLNAEARGAVFVIADTGLRLSEAVNLNETTIHLDCDIPYVEGLPDGRRVKTQDSIRTIPLVGCALAALKRHPKGLPAVHRQGRVVLGLCERLPARSRASANPQAHGLFAPAYLQGPSDRS